MNYELKLAIMKKFGTQRRFARRVGIREAELSKIVHRKVKNMDFLLRYRICNLLDLNTDEIFPR